MFGRTGSRFVGALTAVAVVALSIVTWAVAPAVSAAAPIVDLWAPATINLSIENGTQGAIPNHIYAMAIVRHDPGTTVNGVRFDLVHSTSGGTYGSTNCSTTASITCSGGYKSPGGWSFNSSGFAMTVRELPGQAAATTSTNSNYSQVWLDITPPNFDSWQNDGPDGGNNGICGIEGGTRWCQNTASFSFRLSDGQTTGEQQMVYRSAAESNSSGQEDFPMAYVSNSTNQAAVAAGAQGAVTINYTCDDNDSGAPSECDSAKIRFRRLGDNAAVNPGPSSDSAGNLTCLNAASGPGCETRTDNGNYVVGFFNADDNVNRAYTFRSPRSRGLYMIEAMFCNENGTCPNTGNYSETNTTYGLPGATWQTLGSFYVNDAAPTVSFGTTTQTGGGTVVTHPTTGALHPNTGTTLTYNLTTSSDTQVIDWNLDQNNVNGINSSGYESRAYGTVSYASSAGTPTVTKTASLNLSGYGAGINCAVAARVFDTGGVNATDVSALSANASRTCTTNHIPTGTSQSGVQTARGAATAINLAASDADKWTNALFAGANGDEAPTINITQPAQGTVTCGAFTATTASTGSFPCTYSPGAAATPGLFNFSYTVTDSHNGTSASATVTGSIRPVISAALTPPANANGWNNTNATVTFTCTSSATPLSCTSPIAFTTETATGSATGTATDSIGNSASVTYSPVKIDKTAPTGSGAATTAPNGAGWYNGNVEIDWTCADPISAGVSSGVASCPANSTITGEGAALNASASVTDNASNSTGLTSPTVKIDRTAPSTSVSAIPTWSTSNVVVALTPSDNLSGVVSTSYRVDGGAFTNGTSATVTGDGVHTLEYRSTDAAGNVETLRSATVRIDGTAPTISAAKSPLANIAGWNNSDVTVTFTCADGTSGVASCTPPSTSTTETASQNVSGTATDNAGNSASTSETVKLDKTAPTITGNRSPAANSSGWNNTPVTASFSCNDALSGIWSCTAPTVLSGEGASQSVAGSAIDTAGNATPASVTDINIDTTAPSITASASGTPNGFGYHAAPVTVTFECSDALSGIGAGDCPDPIVVNAGGTQTISGTATDLAGNSATASVTLNVAVVPTATPQSVSAPRGVGTNIVLGQTGSFPDPTSFTVVTPPTKGTLDCNGALGEDCIYTGGPAQIGADSFQFVVDNGFTSAPATVTIDITNQAPTGDMVTGNAARGVATPFTLTGQDPNGDPITFAKATDPAKGVVSCLGPVCTYTASPGTSGADSFTYTVSDGSLTSAAATVAITITNQAPTANSQSTAAARGVATPVTLTGQDLNNDALTFSVVAPPTKGVVECTGVDGSECSYTAGPGTSGSDSFSFRANDGDLNSASAVVSITITNQAPIANNATETAGRTIPTPIVLSGSDPNGDALTFAVVGQPTKGGVTCGGADGSECTYTSAAGQTGTDSFTYRANDGQLNSALATVTVTLVTNPPTVEPQSVTAPRGVATPLTLSGTDPNGDALTFSVVTEPTKGTLECTGDDGAACVYTAGPGTSGTDSFTYASSNGTSSSAPATFTITITNQAPVANAHSTNAARGVATSIMLSGSDPNGDPITFAVVGQPSKGNVSCVGADLADCTYTAGAGQTGADSFTYTATDGSLTSIAVTVSITITNQAPVANAQTVLANAPGTPTPITLSGTDVNDDPLSFVAPVTSPTKGAVTCSATSCTYTTTPGRTGTDSFTFRVEDGFGGTSTQTVSLVLDSTTPGLAIAGTQAVEPDASTVNARRGPMLPVTLSAPSPVPLTVWYYTVSNSATSGTTSDYLPWGTPSSPRSITFQPGTMWMVIGVPVLEDDVIEADETFQVVIAGVTGGPSYMQAGQANVTIWDSDSRASNGNPVLGVQSAVGQVEGNATSRKVQYRMELSKPATSPLSVTATVKNGATTVRSFTATYAVGELGKSFDIPLAPNTVVNPTASYTMTFAVTSGPSVNIVAPTSVSTVLDDD